MEIYESILWVVVAAMGITILIYGMVGAAREGSRRLGILLLVVGILLTVVGGIQAYKPIERNLKGVATDKLEEIEKREKDVEMFWEEADRKENERREDLQNTVSGLLQGDAIVVNKLKSAEYEVKSGMKVYRVLLDSETYDVQLITYQDDIVYDADSR